MSLPLDTGFESQHNCLGVRMPFLLRLCQNLVGQVLASVIPFDVDQILQERLLG